ncbi:hypothetical protein AB4Z22_31370, partial [Paenibacillus sp. TAF58]
MMIEVEVEVVDDFVNLFISNEKVHENIMSEIYATPNRIVTISLTFKTTLEKKLVHLVLRDFKLHFIQKLFIQGQKVVSCFYR